MDFLTVLGIAVALAMDALAVALATGVSLKHVSFRQTFRLAWHFGLFQAMMPVIGWAGGLTVRSYIERYGHWIAFSLLALVGGNMLKEAFEKDEQRRQRRDPTRGLTMVMLATATSIDALAVGLSLSMLNVSIWMPATVIGVVALVFTAAGMHIGHMISSAPRFSKYAEACGGLVLFIIGLKILHDHGALFF